VALEDGRVLVLGDLHMRGRESGVELDQPLGWLLTFRDGKLLRYEVFADQGEARRAAGLAGASG
jgi:ketosteroid isomerase-like protein